MLLIALTATLLGTAPPAGHAETLQRRKAWDELYLAYSAVKAESYSAEERVRIGQALESGCRALEKTDAVMAFSLAETAARFESTEGGLLCLARSARAAQQRGSAEAALRMGMARYPRATGFPLELGSLLLAEGDPVGAVAALEQVPAGTRAHTSAQRLLRTARQQIASDRAALAQAQSLEQKIEQGQPVSAPRRVETAGGSSGPSLTYTSGELGGMRTRGNSRFTIKYFNNARDFGERAEYEGQIVAALEEAEAAARRVLGVSRSTAVDVVLYTQQEFAAHFNSQMARRVAGLYSMDSIRINDAAELNRRNRATLVHEYVHAIVDDLTETSRLPIWLNEGLAEYVEWRYLGQEGPSPELLAQLRMVARSNQLPRLRDLDRGAPINARAPHLAYATSAVAVRSLLSQGGISRLLELIKEVGAGTRFEEALQARYGRSLEDLEGDVRSELIRR